MRERREAGPRVLGPLDARPVPRAAEPGPCPLDGVPPVRDQRTEGARPLERALPGRVGVVSAEQVGERGVVAHVGHHEQPVRGVGREQRRCPVEQLQPDDLASEPAGRLLLAAGVALDDHGAAAGP